MEEGYFTLPGKTKRLFWNPKVMEVWSGSDVFPFRRRDSQVNHVKFEGSALPGTNKYTKGSWEDEFSFPFVGNLSSVEGIV